MNGERTGGVSAARRLTEFPQGTLKRGTGDSMPVPNSKVEAQPMSTMRASTLRTGKTGSSASNPYLAPNGGLSPQRGRCGVVRALVDEATRVMGDRAVFIDAET